MNADPENFEQLKKLLALKRHEQPPPGYFNQLPRNILARIEAGEQEESFWSRLLPKLILRPSFAYGFGLAACAMLVAGVGYALKTEPSPNMSQPAVATFNPVAPDNSSAPLMAGTPKLMAATNVDISSTNPILNQPLFQPDIKVLPANYSGQNR